MDDTSPSCPTLTVEEAGTAAAALDSYEYHGLAESHERDSGYAFLPEDVTPGSKMWQDPARLDEDDLERHEAMRACRELRERIVSGTLELSAQDAAMLDAALDTHIVEQLGDDDADELAAAEALVARLTAEPVAERSS